MNKVKVKIIALANSGNPQHSSRLENAINSFIEENNIEVVDIKYSCTAWPVYNGGHWTPSALILYRPL
ncbi:MAG: sporulation protein Cse60 [Muribaculaceae bacterium]